MNTSTVADSMLVVACPHCHALVRTPSDRVSEHPKCPKCKSALFAGRVIALDSSSFATHTGKSAIPLLVDFWAPWCGPCKMMAPVLDRVAQEWATALHIGKVNTDEEQLLANRFNIRSIPTLILFRDGREIARRSGAMDATALQRWLSEAFGHRR